jgi:hypothetical protein
MLPRCPPRFKPRIVFRATEARMGLLAVSAQRGVSPPSKDALACLILIAVLLRSGVGQYHNTIVQWPAAPANERPQYQLISLAQHELVFAETWEARTRLAFLLLVMNTGEQGSIGRNAALSS